MSHARATRSGWMASCAPRRTKPVLAVAAAVLALAGCSPTPTRSATFSWRPALEPSRSLRLISSFNPGLKPWITCRWASPPRRGRSGVRRSRRRRPPRLSLMRSGRRLKRRRPKHGRSARRRLQPPPRPAGVLRQLRFAGRTESIKKAATAVARCYEARSIASRGAFLRTSRI